MADERDPKVSQRYRELGAEAPPRALDESIVAAARAATERPHAPLVTPVGRHRWYFSLAAAAIILLAVAVTVHVERDRPDPEMGVTTAPVPAQKDEAAREAKPDRPDSAPKPMAQPRAQASLAEPPERWLERIAQLRKEGRHGEADKELAEFRRRFPDYRISEAMLERVEKK